MNMNPIISRPLTWFVAALLAVVVAGCGGGSDSSVALNSDKAITSFTIGGVVGVIDQTAKTIALTVPNGTPVTAMVATFTNTGSVVKVGNPAVTQVSGITANDFTITQSYTVTAADASTATYTVNVTVASVSSKAITAFSLAGVTGVIAEPAHTIAVTLPFGTSTTQVATFSSTGASVAVGATAQTSGATSNSFASPVTYRVTATDSTFTDYVVTVSVAANSAKAITVFSLAGVTGVITEPAHTIAVTLPFGTSTTQVATFTSTGASVAVGITAQTSGATSNSFASPVSYLVTALDASAATYVVTVTVAPAVGPVVCGGASGANCVDLLSAANYVILDEATVTFTPIATITTTPTIIGDIGVSPAAASFMTGFALALDPASCFSTSTRVVGKLYAADYSSVNGCATATTDTATILTTAVSDKNAAYSAALLKAPAGGGLTTACPGGGAMSDGTGGGSGGPIAAGVYTCAVNVTIPGNLTLNGNATDVWVFQITGTLSQSAATSVLLSGGALPQNVFWIVSNGVSVGAAAHMEGVVMSATDISLVTGATVTGRLFGRTGVLMDGNSVNQP